MGETPKEPTSFNPRDWGKPSTGSSAKPAAPEGPAATTRSPADTTSFNPKDWKAAGESPITPEPTSAETQAPAAIDAAATSFNPKSWAAAPAAGAAPARQRAQPNRRGLIFGGAAIAGLALVGGGVWWALQGPGSTPARSRAKQAVLANAPITDAQRQALVVRQPGDILGALTGAGVPQAEATQATTAAAAKLIKRDADLTLIMMVKPAQGGNHLVSLDARYEDGAGVVVKADGSGFTVEATSANLKTVVKVVRGEMDAYSFYTSAVAQHLTDSLISPFAQALAFDFDFQREVHAGDVFEAAFEDRENPKGESVGVGRLLYVSMETKDKSRALYWFQPPSGEAGWFDGNGRSTVRSLMRTPVEGARISSTFGMREHPVLGFMKMHKGVDFAAPTGTPIYAAGDGVVLNAEFKDLNGNYVKLQHDNGWKTIYLHMSAFGPGIAAGVRVHQGQQIGAIGTTGRSTGPHLHYELHINDEPVDPMSVPMENGKSLDGAALQGFFKERNRIDTLRAAQTG